MNKFVASKSGFNEFRNEGFIQSECLSVAQDIGTRASGQTGVPVSCDVQPGKTRCHARASATVSRQSIGSKKWFAKGVRGSDIAKALGDGAVARGGKKVRRKSKTKGAS